MRVILMLMLLVALPQFLEAQVRYFLQADGNLSMPGKIKNTGSYVNTFAPNPNETDIRSSSTFKQKPGFGIGGGVQFALNEQVHIETSAGLKMFAYRQKNKYDFSTVDGTAYTELSGIYYHGGLTYPDYLLPVQARGTPYAPNAGVNLASPALQKKQGNVNLGMVSLAAFLRFNLTPKTTIGVGPSADMLVWAKTYNDKVYVLASPDPDYTFQLSPMTQKTNNKKDFTPVIANANLQVEQQLTNHFAVQASFSQGINKLYKDDAKALDGGKARMRYVSLGLRYYIK